MQVVLHNQVVLNEIANLTNPETSTDHFPTLRNLHLRLGNYIRILLQARCFESFQGRARVSACFQDLKHDSIYRIAL